MKKPILFSLLILLSLQLLIYIDRGIIPGSTLVLKGFIESYNPTGLPSVYIGILQSAFIGSLSAASLGFAYLSKYFFEASLILYGMVLWVLSEIIAGISYYVKSNPYYVLFFGRLFNGVGEAALVSFICPLILRNTEGKEIRYFMGISCAILPLGTAIGYAYAGLISTRIGWNFSFLILAIITIPILLILFLFPYVLDPTVKTNIFGLKSNQLPPTKNDDDIVSSPHTHIDSELSSTPPRKVQFKRLLSFRFIWSVITDFFTELIQVIGKPEFLLISLTYASFSASVIALSTFGAEFLRGLNYIQDDATASLLMGGIVAVTGTLGGFIGGHLASTTTKSNQNDNSNEQIINSGNNVELETSRINQYNNYEALNYLGENEYKDHTDLNSKTKTLTVTEMDYINRHTDFLQVEKLMLYMIPVTALSTIILSCVAYFENIYLFLGLLSLGLSFVFMTQANLNIGVMLVVPTEARSLSIATSVILLHLFGDVPSPIIIGAIKDILAPACSVLDPTTQQFDPKCFEQTGGLRITIFIIGCWLAWMIIGVTAAYILVRHRNKKAKSQKFLLRSIKI